MNEAKNINWDLDCKRFFRWMLGTLIDSERLELLLDLFAAFLNLTSTTVFVDEKETHSFSQK